MILKKTIGFSSRCWSGSSALSRWEGFQIRSVTNNPFYYFNRNFRRGIQHCYIGQLTRSDSVIWEWKI